MRCLYVISSLWLPDHYTFLKNYQIFDEAHWQMEKMLLGMANAPGIALEIMSRLERAKMVLLLCATKTED